MPQRGHSAIVFGGGSGLGAASARALAEDHFVVVADLDAGRAQNVAGTLNRGLGVRADVTEDDEIQTAIQAATSAGVLRTTVICAGVLHVERLVDRAGQLHQRDDYERVISINLTGTFNALRFAAAAMVANEPDDDGQRGVAVLTASVASFDGQSGQVAYASAKAGVAGMVLPAARDLASSGIRVCGIAPGAFETPLLAGLSERARAELAAHVPFPRRLGRPDEFGQMVRQIVENRMLNGEVVRLDAGLRMPHRPPSEPRGPTASG